MRSSAPTIVSRARILSAVFICVAALLLLRLYFVQIVHGEEHRRSAQGQYVAAASDSEDRGDIFFSKKGGELVAAAVMQSGWRLAIAPSEMRDPEAVLEKLRSFVPVDRERFLASAGKAADPYEEVAFRLGDEAALRIRKEKIPGVILVPDRWRVHRLPGTPHGT